MVKKSMEYATYYLFCHYTDTHVAVGDFQAGDALEDLLHLPLRRRNSIVGRHFYDN